MVRVRVRVIDLDQSPVSRGRDRDELGQAVTRGQSVGRLIGSGAEGYGHQVDRILHKVRARVRVRV